MSPLRRNPRCRRRPRSLNPKRAPDRDPPRGTLDIFQTRIASYPLEGQSRRQFPETIRYAVISVDSEKESSLGSGSVDGGSLAGKESATVLSSILSRFRSGPEHRRSDPQGPSLEKRTNGNVCSKTLPSYPARIIWTAEPRMRAAIVRYRELGCARHKLLIGASGRFDSEKLLNGFHCQEANQPVPVCNGESMGPACSQAVHGIFQAIVEIHNW